MATEHERNNPPANDQFYSGMPLFDALEYGGVMSIEPSYSGMPLFDALEYGGVMSIEPPSAPPLHSDIYGRNGNEHMQHSNPAAEQIAPSTEMQLIPLELDITGLYEVLERNQSGDNERRVSPRLQVRYICALIYYKAD
jgi:hypothetical protein